MCNCGSVSYIVTPDASVCDLDIRLYQGDRGSIALHCITSEVSQRLEVEVYPAGYIQSNQTAREINARTLDDLAENAGSHFG